MSIHKRGESRYQVKWREGGRQHSRTFDRKGDAEIFETDVKRRRQLGTVMFTELTRPTLTESIWRAYCATTAALICDLGMDPHKLIGEVERIARWGRQ